MQFEQKPPTPYYIPILPTFLKLLLSTLKHFENQLDVVLIHE